MCSISSYATCSSTLLTSSSSSSCSFPCSSLKTTILTLPTTISNVSVSATPKHVWTRTPRSPVSHTNKLQRRTRTQQQQYEPSYLDRSVDMKELLTSIGQTHNVEQLYALMSPFNNRQLSIRFMVSILSREPDWQRSIAILDWMNEKARYSPSLSAYNVVLRNVLRAKQWHFAHGLFDEMRQKGLSPDRYTYSTLITCFSKQGLFDSSFFWLQQMERDKISGDLVLYSNLIEFARKLCDYSKAISIFNTLKASANIAPDLIAYNTMICVFGKAKLLREARLLLQEMREKGVSPNTASYSTLLAIYVDNQKFVEALSLFSEMNELKCPIDLTTCNIMIDVYGQLQMIKEADCFFWGMKKMGIEPNVVSYNTILRVYGEAELFGEAVHLFSLMQRKGIPQNVVTYNTMINIYGKSLEHEKATNLIQEMQSRGIQPNAITYSTIISIWEKAGKLDRAAMLFHKLRTSGVKIDEVLYQTMIVAYQKAGLVAHAKRLLNELKQQDNVSRETAITILAKAGKVDEAMWVFRQAFDAGEVKDISVFGCIIDIFSMDRKYAHVVEVFEKMREVGHFPDSNVIALVLNAFGKLRQFERADALYKQMYEEGCVFSDEVHFQMLGLYGERRDFKMVESLFEKLDSYPNINKKELHFVVAHIYERADRFNDASRIMSRMNHKAKRNDGNA
ncbi:LOW QUALITY PROTEIN: pentatricopeptide repeat-containing protein At5g39980, chloroplastic [Lathyrus oleraceus]|uniref:LOW QUALITY PROTEIN: pentatricopeptide repeat-containing protein At5g39980, chloroplastic n=1 Tax=Pisum sativum TaxID=3888 RepID=UPI0021D0765F|nr:LOW QUALITY PROTEIN: pentatricopeptide repeat-containing protein At5g39980, chloroplastic [Pisum sativum]